MEFGFGVIVGVDSSVAVGLGVGVKVEVEDGSIKTFLISFMLCKPVTKAQIAIQLEITPIISTRVFFDDFFALLSCKFVSFIKPTPVFQEDAQL
jgi:hypothetical protein